MTSQTAHNLAVLPHDFEVHVLNSRTKQKATLQAVEGPVS